MIDPGISSSKLGQPHPESNSFETLQLHQLYCNITADNTASFQLFQNAGFERVGVRQEWIKGIDGWKDEVMLQLINPLHSITPS